MLLPVFPILGLTALILLAQRQRDLLYLFLGQSALTVAYLIAALPLVQ